MKILLIHHRLPYPLVSGTDKVTYGLIRTLAKDHQVTLLVPMDNEVSAEHIRQVEKICTRVIPVLVSNQSKRIGNSKYLFIIRWLRLIFLKIPVYVTDYEYAEIKKRMIELCANERFDLIQAINVYSSAYIDVVTDKNIKKALGPFDDVVEAARTNGKFSDGWRRKLFWKLELRARAYFQPGNCRQAHYVFFHDPNDLNHIAGLAGGLPHAAILPLAIEPEDIPLPQKPYQEPDSLIFVGGLGSNFNQDAVVYFYQKIFPMIKAALPAVKFYVVGQNPPADILRLQTDPSVIVTGKVPDVRPYIEKAMVYVAPVRAGTGFKTKIVEALCLGKSIVASSLALSGLWSYNDQALSVCDDPDEFAREVIKLLTDAAYRLQMEAHARKLYEQSYSFESVAPKTLAIYSAIEKELAGEAACAASAV